jgi:hypothetical protein
MMSGPETEKFFFSGLGANQVKFMNLVKQLNRCLPLIDAPKLVRMRRLVEITWMFHWPHVGQSPTGSSSSQSKRLRRAKIHS